jgi:hypothetical protein
MGNTKTDIIDKKLQTFGLSTRPNDTTALSANDIVGSTLYFSNVGKFGQGFIILKASMFIKANAIPSGLTSLRVHFYKNSPSVIADNAPFNLAVADRANYLGYITFDNFLDLGDTVFCQVENLAFTGIVDVTTLYGYIETTTAWTPTALLEIEVKLFGVDS